MDKKTLFGGALVIAGLIGGGYFGYRYLQGTGAVGALEDGREDYNSNRAAAYYGRQAEFYREQRRLRRMRGGF